MAALPVPICSTPHTIDSIIERLKQTYGFLVIKKFNSVLGFCDNGNDDRKITIIPRLRAWPQDSGEITFVLKNYDADNIIPEMKSSRDGYFGYIRMTPSSAGYEMRQKYYFGEHSTGHIKNFRRAGSDMSGLEKISAARMAAEFSDYMQKYAGLEFAQQHYLNGDDYLFTTISNTHFFASVEEASMAILMNVTIFLEYARVRDTLRRDFQKSAMQRRQ